LFSQPMSRMNSEQFERLYEEHAQRLFGFFAYRTGDAALAEDLVADTFERVFTARQPFDRRKASEKTWLYTIALNRLRDSARHEAAESRALTLATPPVAIMAALATLNDEEREALSLRYGADLSLKDIAKVIGKPRSTVEGRIYKGLRRVRAELTGEGQQLAEARAALG
jgi:RNA polymerase sigma-70 factor, ECF subfamily